MKKDNEIFFVSLGFMDGSLEKMFCLSHELIPVTGTEEEAEEVILISRLLKEKGVERLLKSIDKTGVEETYKNVLNMFLDFCRKDRIVKNMVEEMKKSGKKDDVKKYFSEILSNIR